MDLIIGFGCGIAFLALVNKLQKISADKELPPGENDLCKNCKYHDKIIELIDYVEVD